jgi:hypothetical protein
MVLQKVECDGDHPLIQDPPALQQSKRPLSRRLAVVGVVVGAAGSLLLLGSCDDRPDQWDAYIYPSDDLIRFEAIRGFKTFELCQRAAIDRLRLVRPDGGGSYECGYKCGPSARYGGMNLCKETRD